MSFLNDAGGEGEDRNVWFRDVLVQPAEGMPVSVSIHTRPAALASVAVGGRRVLLDTIRWDARRSRRRTWATSTPLFAAAPEETTAVAPGWAYAETLAGGLDHGWAPLHAIRSDDYHYIRAPRPELFEVARDPGQLTNLLSEESAETAAPVARAERAITELLSGSQAQDTVAVDAATRERIEALGYVVPTGPVAKNGADPKDVHRLADHWYQALALLFAKKYGEAERVALTALRQMPQSSQLHEVLARIYVESHREERALPHALEAARLNPAWSDHQALVAYIALRLGDGERALAAFERAAALDPEHAGAHVGLMWKRRAGGTLEETEEHARWTHPIIQPATR